MIKLSGRLQWLAYFICALFVAHLKTRDELHPVLAILAGLAVMAAAIVGVYCLLLPVGFTLAHLAQKNKTALAKVSDVPPPLFSELAPFQWALVIIDEILLSLRTFLIFQPWFEHKGLKTSEIKNLAITEPVLLIHGLMCNSGAWKETRQFMANLGATTYAVNLEPPLASIDDYADQIHQAIEELKQATSTQQVKVLSHSMGGIVLRAYVRKYGEESISSAITLGSPHHGTALAALGKGKNVRQMDLGSTWLKELGQCAADIAFRKKIIALWSSQDNIVSPQHSAILPGATSIEIHACGHLALIKHRQVRKIIANWICGQ